MSDFVLPSLDANISRFTDPFSTILGLLESPCPGLYRRKKSSPIESLDPEIFAFKVEALQKALDLIQIFNIYSRQISPYECDFNIIIDQIMDFLLNKKNFAFDKSKRIQVMIENYITAKYYTGICYLNGMGIEKSNVKAFKYFEQLFKEAEENYVNGMVMLGYCYINGIGTEINKKKWYWNLNKAIFWIKRSAKESINGKDILNTLYTYSRNVEKDDKNSFLHVKKEVEKGDKEAIYNLGKYYEYRVGGKVNKDKAFELYKQAADNEFLEAISLLNRVC
ncbi:unnamed protein product [Rhizophagus irregularis]|nr:unnamed protein product [Rhizophagus irregularis]